jgi:hypothetical protein
MCDVANTLDNIREEIVEHITGRLEAIEASYTTVWRNYEDAAITAFIEIVRHHIPTLTDNNFQTGVTGREKNRIADLAIVCQEGSTLISIKTADSAKNPENDLGTFRQYAGKKAAFPNSFDLWIRWTSNDGTIDADGVFFDRSYHFVGKMQIVDGVKYRKKDGNMRPKSWAMFDDDESYWENVEDFEAAMLRSMRFRANSLVQEHLESMTEDDQRMLYGVLHEKYGGE